MRKTKIGVFVFLVVVLAIFSLLPRIDTFQSSTSAYKYDRNLKHDNKERVLTSQRLNFEEVLQDNFYVVSLPYNGWDYMLYRINSSQPIETFRRPSRVILDQIDYEQNAKQFMADPLPVGHFYVFTDPNKRDEFQCGFDFQGKKIGFFDRCEKRFIENVLYGYRITGKPILLSVDRLENLSSIWKEVDILVLYIVPKSPLCKLIEKQPLALLDLSKISMERLRITNPWLQLEEVPKESVFPVDNRVLTPNDTSMFLVSTTLLLVNIYERREEKEGFLTRLSLSPEFYDKDYTCANDETIVSKYACESPYDVYGKPKTTPTFIDKPCNDNSDCPFYRANKNYPNDFGRCLPDGKCEMPIGITRMGHRKYYDRDPYQPFCYQCKNPKEPYCCDEQKKAVELNELYPRSTPFTYLKSPDYAFPDDTDLRKEANLPIFMNVQI